MYGPQRRGTAQLLAEDGTTVLKEKDETLNRFAQHFYELLNVPGTVDRTALDCLPDKPACQELDSEPSRDELNTAIAATRENKAPGGCGIPA